MSSLTYSEKLKDPRWQKKRLEIFKRDGFACLDCSSRVKMLHVHHCHYSRGGPWETPSEFLMTLCHDCHESRQLQEGRVKLALAKILRRQMCNGSFDAIELMAIQMEKLASDDESAPMFIEEMDYDHASDMRWFSYACDNPKFRKAYEAVVGQKRKWENYDKLKTTP